MATEVYFGPSLTSGIKWIYKDTSCSVANGEGIMADTSGGVWNLTLPATPTMGDRIGVSDFAGSFNTFNLTILCNGNLIHGIAEDLTIDLKDASFLLIYSGSITGWKLDTYLTRSGGD